jgi:hypothetical protein
MYKEFEKILTDDSSVGDAFVTIEKESNALLSRFHDTYN